MNPPFPFSALVGQDDLKLALLLATLDPSLGGVLLRGERGTAKSTAARGLAALLPPRAEGGAAPFVELPLGATEDRVVGSLDVESALREGRPRLRSGLLARAHGGVLYVDEVNLLPDHLVDLLLDAAASGRVTVERDGVSASEPAKFILLGSMNPEEGELRPQFLDRFGLHVEVRAPAEVEARVATVQARLAYDAAPESFVRQHAAAEEALRVRLAEARARLGALPLAPALLIQASSLCAQLGLDGLRGDIVLAKGARALAAWEDADEVTPDHLQRVAPFALGHRRRRKPRDPLPPAQQSFPPPQPPPPAVSAADHGVPPPQVAPAAAASSLSLELPPQVAVASGRREAAHGAPAGAVRVVPRRDDGTLALAPTLAAAAARGATIEGGRVELRSADLRQQERRGRQAGRVLIIVDASGSMGAQRRLSLAKGVVLGLLDASYQRRDEVGLMLVAGEAAELRLPFTRRTEQAEAALRDLPTGGRTPLAHALQLATELCTDAPPAAIVLFTDGRANVAASGGDPWREALAASAALAPALAGSLVIDCEPGPVRLGRARELSAVLGAELLALDGLDAAQLTVRLRNRLLLP